MGDDLRDLARHLNLVADDLDARGYSYAGAVRRAARALFERPNENPAEDSQGCEGCGALLVRKARGRRRLWCGRGRCENYAKKRV